jgi:hypothetical protein
MAASGHATSFLESGTRQIPWKWATGQVSEMMPEGRAVDGQQLELEGEYKGQLSLWLLKPAGPPAA